MKLEMLKTDTLNKFREIKILSHGILEGEQKRQRGHFIESRLGGHKTSYRFVIQWRETVLQNSLPKKVNTSWKRWTNCIPEKLDKRERRWVGESFPHFPTKRNNSITEEIQRESFEWWQKHPKEDRWADGENLWTECRSNQWNQSKQEEKHPLCEGVPLVQR